jgi:hypothetical protein
MKAVAAILGLFITMPIWFFLLYRILEAIIASELTWFLYWVYVPVGIIVGVLSKVAEE